MVLWSLIAALQALMTGRTSFFICRALLGLFEGGFVPDTVLYLSYYYKSVELPKRLSWFWTTYEFTSIVSAFLAYGMLDEKAFISNDKQLILTAHRTPPYAWHPWTCRLALAIRARRRIDRLDRCCLHVLPTCRPLPDSKLVPRKERMV